MPNITEEQYRTVLQNIQNRYIWIELLNYQFQTVEELNGVVVGGNITINANSDIRRTGNIELVVNNSTFEVESGGKIWLDKYIRIWIGTQNLITQQITKTNCGIFIIDAPNYRYDQNTNILNLNLLDLMAKLTGVRNGYLKGTPVKLSAGENIRKAIIDTLALGGFDKYVVEEAPNPKTIPNDLDFNQGTTVYEILQSLKNIYPNYEMYFDVNGTFFYKPIPTGQNEPILVNDSIWDSIVLSENLATDFQNIKNSIEVYGRIHDPQYFSTKTIVEGSNITLTIDSLTEYKENLIYGFTLKDNKGIINPKLQIGSLGYHEIKEDDGKSITILKEEGEIIFCVQYSIPYYLTVDGKIVVESNNSYEFLNAVNQKYNKQYKQNSDITEGTVSSGTPYWRWLGHLQAYGFAEDLNPNSPFYINSSVGKIRLPLFDQDYANCLTDNLAQQRAEYELWKRTNLNNTVNIATIPVFWLDVNILTEYTLKRNNKKGLYIIKNINFGLGPTDSCNISMIQFYPEQI